MAISLKALFRKASAELSPKNQPPAPTTQSYRFELSLSCEFYNGAVNLEDDTYFGVLRKAVEAYELMLADAEQMEPLIPTSHWSLGLQFPNFHSGKADEGCGSGLESSRNSIPSFYHWMLIFQNTLIREETETFAAIASRFKSESLTLMSNLYAAAHSETDHIKIRESVLTLFSIMESALEPKEPLIPS